MSTNNLHNTKNSNSLGNLLTNSLEYYDINNEKYKYLFEDVRYIYFTRTDDDMDHNTITMYDENEKEIFKSKYEVLGMFDSHINIWTWGWAVPTLKKNSTTIIRKVFNYGAELDPNDIFLKSELVTSRFRISHPVQLDVHVAMASYLSKKPVVYKLYTYYKNVNENKKYLDIKYNKDLDDDYMSDRYRIVYLFILDYTEKQDTTYTSTQ